MTPTAQIPRTLRLFAAVFMALAICLPISSQSVDADPLRGGLFGALGGGVIGGIVGGGGGLAVGAIMGGVVGTMVGSADQSRKRRAYHQAQRPRRVAQRPSAAASNPVVTGIQSSLTSLGYNPGPVDGKVGGATAGAISSYQAKNGLLVTGQPSDALLQHMQASAK